MSKVKIKVKPTALEAKTKATDAAKNTKKADEQLKIDGLKAKQTAGTLTTGDIFDMLLILYGNNGS